jgi:hypothetical protein
VCSWSCSMESERRAIAKQKKPRKIHKGEMENEI